VALAGLAITTDPLSQDFRLKELKSTLVDFTRERHGLIYGDTGLGLPGEKSTAVLKLLNSIEPNYQALLHDANGAIQIIQRDKAAGKAITPGEVMAYTDNALSQEEMFATTMNITVAQIQHEAEDRVRNLRIIEVVLCLLTLCVLLLEGCFVFRPAVQRLRQTIADLMQANERISRAEVTRKRAERILALNEALAASQTSQPHARIVALGHYQVRSKEGQYQDVHYREVDGQAVFSCACPQYQQQRICAHSLAAAALHSVSMQYPQGG
jgi:hypothetical protein